MTDYPLLIALFSVPFLLGRLRTFRKGLVTSLFILLLFLGNGSLLTLIIPISSAVFLFFMERKRAVPAREQSAFVKNPFSFISHFYGNFLRFWRCVLSLWLVSVTR